jgi:hypothetical protein
MESRCYIKYQKTKLNVFFHRLNFLNTFGLTKEFFNFTFTSDARRDEIGIFVNFSTVEKIKILGTWRVSRRDLHHAFAFGCHDQGSVIIIFTFEVNDTVNVTQYK